MCKRRKLEHSKVMRWLSGCLIRGVVSPVQFKEADNEGLVPPSLPFGLPHYPRARILL